MADSGGPGGGVEPSILVRNVGELTTNDPLCGRGLSGVRSEAAFLVEHGRVAWVGEDAAIPEAAGDEVVDVGGRAVVPGFVDPHTHCVFAGDRGKEWAARMSGEPYAAGGISVTVEATRAASDEQLEANAARLFKEAERSGTTTMECKSGYGLTVRDEARSLVIAGRFTEETTYLGAHVVPKEFSAQRDRYVELVCTEMLEACAPHARWVDVFCDRGAFDRDEALAVLSAGQRRGLLPRVHGNQLEAGPGVQVAVEEGAASVDHCTYLSDADVELLATSGTVATLLPACDFSLRAAYPDARRLIDAGVHVALGTDCNPGTSYTTSMPLCIALGVRELYLSPEEALRAATLGGARALVRDDVGHLGVGARADFVVLEAPSFVHLAYRPGVAMVHGVWKDGRHLG